jgi:hypothetical protein
MAPPVIERDATKRPHPGAEPIVYPLSEAPADDTATIRAVKGKGLVATITPHFAVAVIVGVITAVLARKPDPISEGVGNDARRCNESVTQLRSDFSQYKAETESHFREIERLANQLLARDSGHYNPPQVAPTPLDSAISRQLQK